MNNLKKIKKNSFLSKYLEYCENLETPKSFDFWSGIWILSMLCNRQVKILRPNAPLFPNFYITFIADSGICRKSTAVSLAKTILSKIIDNSDKITIVDSKSSEAKFVYELTKSSKTQNSCILGINSSEFITFFKNKTVIESFIDFYDCPERRIGYGTFQNGDIELRNVFVSCLAGSTPNYYFKAISKEEIEGGFTSRSIIIKEEKGKKKIAWGTECRYDGVIDAGKKLRKFLHKCSNSAVLSPDAIRRYTSWYTKRRLSNDIYTKSFESREQDFVLKLACILSINSQNLDKKGNILINSEEIDQAIKIIKEIKINASNFFNSTVYEEENDDMFKKVKRLIDIIHSKGANGIKHRELYLRVHNSLSNDDFNYLINLFHELGMIEKLQPYNSKAVIYRETKDIYSIDLESLVAKMDII